MRKFVKGAWVDENWVTIREYDGKTGMPALKMKMQPPKPFIRPPFAER